ncbi:MAG: restriction endonuclease [Bryobacteraceae bacterium]|jgi:hypothetical protein
MIRVHALYQRLRELDWDTFQRLAFQLLAEKHPGLTIRHVEGSGGDCGLDFFAGQLDEHPTIWQCKHFPNGLRAKQRPQVTKSLRTAVHHFHPAQWILVVSIDLDAAANRWFQKLQGSYANRCSLGLFQASDIVRELVHRRNLRDAFFPGAVLDTITLQRALKGLHLANGGDLDHLAQDRIGELIARLEEADARFNYQIVYGPNVGADIATAPPNHPLLVASVVSDDKRIDVFVRDLQAVRLDPPRLTFDVRSSGLRKINELLRTGRPQELDSEEISRANSTFDFLLPEQDISGWRVVLRPAQEIAPRRLPLRLTFAKDDVLIRYEYVQFCVVRTGTEESEIESTSPLPFVLSLVLPSTTGAGSSWEWRFRFEGVHVRDAAKAVQALSLLRDGGSLELYALDAGQVLGTVSRNLTTSIRTDTIERVVVAAAAVCDKYDVDLHMPKSIRLADIRAIELLLAIANGTPMAASDFEARLVKSAEHEANVNSSIAQALQLMSSADRLEPNPVVFGVPVDTGPVTLHASGARIKHPAEFLQRYASAKYGDAVPIAFSVQEVRAHRGPVNRQKLSIKPEP